MKKLLLLLTGIFFSFSLLTAHNLNADDVVLRNWQLAGHDQAIEGSFYMMKGDQVFIEDGGGQVHTFPFSSFSDTDRSLIRQKQDRIDQLNLHWQQARADSRPTRKGMGFWIIGGVIAAAGAFLFFKSRKKAIRLAGPVVATALLAVMTGSASRSVLRVQTTTDPLFIDSAFTPFKPKVYTRWDGTYFYVESNGIADHEMMAGIVSWQQQVPIPQCYTGSNPWSIPLNPVIATAPVPVSPQHFLRGAVAVAVNGIPIFNPFTNTGVDAFLDGQLDNFGGHSGRADDYHYHIAPLSLYSQTDSTLPIAFALDGFAVYGSVEPDGSAMAVLDTNHGHFGPNGVYHYHGTASAPYMIGNMVGQVTEDATLQIIPQAAAHPVRTSRTPLNGAVITHHNPNATGDGYTLIYTRNGQTDSIVYDWTMNGTYNFHYHTSTGTLDSTYHGFSQCAVPVSSEGNRFGMGELHIYPNPSREMIRIAAGEGFKADEVMETSLYSLNGKRISRYDGLPEQIDTEKLTPGTYILRVVSSSGTFSRKLTVQ